MKIRTIINHRKLNKIKILFSITLMIIFLLVKGTMAFSQTTITILNQNPASCGSSNGDIKFILFSPPPGVTQITIYSLIRVSPNFDILINSPQGPYNLSFTLYSLAFGDYWLYTDQGDVSFTIYDDASWPFQPILGIDSRAFNVDLAVDDKHLVYAAGWFDGTITLQNTLTVNQSATFLVQLNQCGIVQWDSYLYCLPLGTCKVNSIHITKDQYIIMSGDWITSGAATLIVGSLGGQTLSASTAGKYGFIAKFDRSNGSCVWAIQINDASNAIQTRDIISDEQGNIFVLGDYDSPVVGINFQDQPNSNIYHNLPPVGGNDVFLAAYNATGHFIDTRSDNLSDPTNNDYAGGLVAVSSNYPTVLGTLVGGNLTEIIAVGQGGVGQPSQSFLGQRWVLDNSLPQQLVYMTSFTLLTPLGGAPVGNLDHFGMSIDYISILWSNVKWLFAISGLVRENSGLQSRPFIASINEPLNWSNLPPAVETINDYYDYFFSTPTVSTFNIASTVAIDRTRSEIRIGGIQRDQSTSQLHPANTGLPIPGVPNSNGVFFIDDFGLNLAMSKIHSTPITNMYSICDPLYPGTIISDNDPTYFDEGYVGLCYDNNEQCFFSGNFGGGVYSFKPAAGWGAVGYNPSSNFFIARIINNVAGEIEFKNNPLYDLKTEINFSINPNPTTKSAYLFSKDANITITQIEILDQTSRIVYIDKNTINTFPAEIDISGLSPGLFFVKIQTSTVAQTIKMLVQ